MYLYNVWTVTKIAEVKTQGAFSLGYAEDLLRGF